MLIDDTEKYNLIWDKVYDKLKFKPSCSYRGHSMCSDLPFEINVEHSVYGIDKMSDDQISRMDAVIREQLIAVSKKEKKWYALDWQHSAFLFDPRNTEDQKSFWKEDSRYFGGGYYAYFPSFYPDGDYYFFIDEYFEYGYLGHPWRQEVWIFGDELIKRFDIIYKELGWEKLR